MTKKVDEQDMQDMASHERLNKGHAQFNSHSSKSQSLNKDGLLTASKME